MKAIYTILMLLSTLWLTAQIQTTQAIKIGTTGPLTSLIPSTNKAYTDKYGILKKQKQIPNFIGRGGGRTPISNPKALPQGRDPLAQQIQQRRTANTDIVPSIVVEGLESNPIVPDPCGEKGPDHYVQLINATNMMVWDNDGTPILSEPFVISTLWNSLGRQSGGDPIILYDMETGRWMITEFPPPFQAFLLVAVSRSADPLGEYDVYEFGTPQFPDYPKYAIWDDAIILTTNEGGAIPAYAINKSQLFGGAAVVDVQRATIPRLPSGPRFQVTTPVDFNGRQAPPASSMPMIMRMNDDSWGDVSSDRLEIFSFDVNWANPSASTLTLTHSLETAPFESDFCPLSSSFGFDCVPQPNGQGIDGIAETLMNQIHYRNQGSHESIVLCHTTDVTGNNHGGIRWYELRQTTGTDWSIYQQGTHSPDTTLHRFIPAIAIDRNSNIGLAYSVSSDSYSPSIRFTGRKASDPLGMMTVTESEPFTGSGSINDDRYGDYASMVVDPVDELTFWFTGEYVKSNRTTSTGILAFSLGRDSVDIKVASFVGPTSADDLMLEDLQYTISNNGIDTIRSYSYGYIFDGETETLTGTGLIAPDSAVAVTFTDALDLSVIGAYSITVFTTSTTDQNTFNDTLNVIVNKLPTYDLAIVDISDNGQSLCGEPSAISVIVANEGTEAIDSFALQYAINDATDVRTISIVQSIAPGQLSTIDLPAINVNNGTNTLEATIIGLGTDVDQVDANDVLVSTFDVVLDGAAVLWRLQLDDYPNETTYVLIDSQNDTIESGGPYLENRIETDEWCLVPDSCYKLVILDALNDGIFENPFLEIIQTELDSTILFVDNLQFRDRYEVEFCLSSQCRAGASISIRDETELGAMDGILMIDPANVTGGYSISIDGGASYSLETIYTGLPGSTYDVIVYDSLAQCAFETTVTLNTCNLEVSFTVQNTSSASVADGRITVTVSDDINDAEYTLVGVREPQEQGFFGLLPIGTYSILITYGNGCSTLIEDVVVDATSSTGEVKKQIQTSLLPNPSDGQYYLTVEGINDRYKLGYYIYDITGQEILHGNLPKYDTQFTGEIRLYHLPAGIYLLRLDHPDASSIIKMVKQ